jgi:hypothetical protein
VLTALEHEDVDPHLRRRCGEQEDLHFARAVGIEVDGHGDVAVDDLKSLTCRRTSIERHEWSAVILRMDPAFRSLRANEEFRRLVVEIGLPPIT